MGLGSAARKKLTKGANATTNFVKKGFVQNVDKTVINPLGKRLGPVAAAGITLGAVAWGVGTGKYVEGRQKTLAENAEYVGNVSSMAYDGVPNVDRTTGKRDFGATGNLVFGLNNSRRG